MRRQVLPSTWELRLLRCVRLAGDENMPKTADWEEAETFLAAHPEIAAIDAIIADLAGVNRGKRLGRHELAKLYNEGLQLPGTTFLIDVKGDSTDPGGRGSSDGDPDHVGKPIPGTLVPVPWSAQPVGQVLLTFFEQDGRPFVADPRHVLARVAARFEELKLKPVVAFELEFYLIDRERTADGAPQPAVSPLTRRRDAATQVYGMTEIEGFAAFLGDVAKACRAQNIPSGAASSEYAPGQYEINLAHTDAPLVAADHSVLLQRVIKGVALRHKLEATFMAKPYPNVSGSGMHLHISLVDETGRNVFDDGSELGSETLRHAVGGMLATMAEATAIFAPNVNSFRRFVNDSFAPTAPTWGSNNRSVAVRIPGGPAKDRRVEHRTAGADANSYLVLAAVLAGIHHGITNRVDSGPPHTGSAYRQVEPTLPASWEAALTAFERAKVIPEYFGRAYCKLYHAVKKGEMDRFLSQISPLEYGWYLRSV